MITVDLVWIFLLISFVAAFGVVLALAIVNFSNKELDNSFLRTFPYEVAEQNQKNSKVYRIFLYIYAGLCFSPLFDIVPNYEKFGNMGALPIIIGCLFGLLGLTVAALHIFEAKFIKAHTIVSTLQIGLTILASALTCLLAILTYNVNSGFNEAKPASIVVAIFSGLIAIYVLVLALNPKLKDWARLDSVANPDGSISYKRPKIFPLAFTEWLVMFSGVAAEILFFLSLIK